MADHLEQAAAGMVVLFVGLEMLGQIVDPPGQDGDLHLRGAGVALMGGIGLHDFGFFLGKHVLHLFFQIFREPRTGNRCVPAEGASSAVRVGEGIIAQIV